MTDREQPLLVTPHAGDVTFTNATLVTVDVTNHTDRIAAYVITVVPRSVVKVVSLPWAKIARDVGEAVQQSGVLGAVQRLFGR